MKIILAGIYLLVVSNLALADVNYYIAKEQARRSAGQDSGSPGASGAPPATPTDPALAQTLRKIANLQADIAALNQSTSPKPTSEAKVALLNDLMSAAQGVKPAVTDVQKLGGHLANALNCRKLPLAAQQSLARNLLGLFNGAHLPAPQQLKSLDAIRKTLMDAGVPAEDLENLQVELKSIATATQ